MSRTPTVVDIDDYIKFMRRIVRAAGERVGEADAEQLADLIAIRNDLDAAIASAVRGLKETGCTWADIAAATGTSRQAAWEKWGKL